MGKPVPVESLHLNRWSGSSHGRPGFQGLCRSTVASVAVWLWHWRSVVQLARAFFKKKKKIKLFFLLLGNTIVRVC